MSARAWRSVGAIAVGFWGVVLAPWLQGWGLLACTMVVALAASVVVLIGGGM